MPVTHMDKAYAPLAPIINLRGDDTVVKGFHVVSAGRGNESLKIGDPPYGYCWILLFKILSMNLCNDVTINAWPMHSSRNTWDRPGYCVRSW